MAPMVKSKGLAATDLVEAYRIHSVVGFVALKRILDGPLKKRNRPNRRDIVITILDSLHYLSSNYSEIAGVLAGEKEFPDRAEIWPALFGSQADDLQATESISDILREVGRLTECDLHKRKSMLERVAEVPENEIAREVLELLFDQAHGAFEFYRDLAPILLSEKAFPNRIDRWPGFFGVDQPTTPTGGD